MKKGIGFILLAAVIAIVAIIAMGKKKGGGIGANGAITLNGFVAGEKIGFVKDPDVIRILADKYGITLKYDRRGSIEMVEDPNAGSKDFLWPASQLAAEIYKESGKTFLGSEIIFNSPIVFYTYEPVRKALDAKGIAHGNTVEMEALAEMVSNKVTWKSLGLNDLFGSVVIFSTDPTRSNSGNMYAALLANVLNGGQVTGDASVPTLLPKIKRFFEAQGFMDESSGVIFQQFVNRGMGDKPIIVGYEAQLLGALSEPGANKRRLGEIRTLYPRPTVWSSHPLIALTDAGRKLTQALQDPEVQKIAWERYGFRAVSGRDSVPTAFKALGVPDSIGYVISLPNARAMKRILAGLEQQ